MTALSPYPSYRQIDIPWLAQIPAHWDVQRAKFIFKKMSRPVREEDDVITAFRDGIVTLRTNRRTEGFTFSIKEIGYQGIRKGDLVIHQMDGFAGAIGVSDSDGKSTPIYSVCVPTIPASTYFYAYLLRHMARSDFILSLTKGIRERSSDFRFDVFKELELPIPPLEEQQAIVAYLDRQTAKIDALIAKKQRLLDLLVEQRAALISQAVTKGLNPKVKMKDSDVAWLGQVPSHWQIKRLGTVSPLLRGHDLTTAQREEGDVPVISSSGFSGYHNIAKARGPGVVTGRYGTTGKMYYIEQDFWPMNTALYVYDFKGNYPRYIYYLLQILPFDAYSGKSAVPGIDRNDLHPLSVCQPPRQEQEKIAAYIDHKLKQLADLAFKVETAIERLQEYRAALISSVVTGKIDIGRVKP